MARKKGTANLSASLEVLAGAPLDSRTVVPTLADLTTAANFPYKYVGMPVVVEATGDLYILTANDVTSSANWKLIGANGSSENYIGGYYKAADGKFYEESTYETEITGDTEKLYVSLDTNVMYRYTGSAFVEVSSDTDTTIQVLELPTAAAALEGKIYQYIGATTSSYTNGYFYKCVSDGEVSPTYSWTNVDVQAPGGTPAELTDDVEAAITVGGIEAGTEYAEGTPLETIIKDLICPTLYPTLVAPSASLSGTGDKLLEAGATQSVTLTATFNRGSITPSYGTSGYRSGAAIGYTLNSGTSQAGNTWTETVSSSNKTFQASVAYAAGEQPKDSKGGNYESPLAAGSVSTGTVSYDFVDAMWANTAAIGTVAKLSLVAKSTKQRDMVFPAATVANPEVFDIPTSWTVTAVQVKNDLSGQYEDASEQFTVTDTTHNNAAGTSVSYKRYTFNMGMDIGSRTVRVKWS